MGPPRLIEAGRYEVYNPTPCTAEVFTAMDGGATRQNLGQVPSGGRVVFAVPPRAPGTRLVAVAAHPDGSDCERGERVRIRRIEP
jgi:hypothetical protein